MTPYIHTPVGAIVFWYGGVINRVKKNFFFEIVYIWGSNSLLPQQSQKTIGPTGSVQVSLLGNKTTLFGRVCNGCSHDFKFVETCLNFCTILYNSVMQNDNTFYPFSRTEIAISGNLKLPEKIICRNFH